LVFIADQHLLVEDAEDAVSARRHGEGAVHENALQFLLVAIADLAQAACARMVSEIEVRRVGRDEHVPVLAHALDRRLDVPLHNCLPADMSVREEAIRSLGCAPRPSRVWNAPARIFRQMRGGGKQPPLAPRISEIDATELILHETIDIAIGGKTPPWITSVGRELSVNQSTGDPRIDVLEGVAHGEAEDVGNG
jgi:hypothetical protein